MTGAAFFDLDRTLLRGASGPILTDAMNETGVVTTKVPGQGLLYGVFDVFGETLPSMVLARNATLVAKGKPATAFDEAAKLAAARLVDLIDPFAHLAIEQHRSAGRQVVLATTTPQHLVQPLADLLGLDAVIATRYSIDKTTGTFDGGLDGPFVWSTGKASAVRAWADQNDIDLAESYAYSDSVYDLPLLSAVGHPRAVNPDPRLYALATLRRWPIQHFDSSPGVAKIPLLGMEWQRAMQLLARPETLPYARFDVLGTEHVPSTGGVLIAANHRSYFDLPTMLLAMGRTGRTGRFMAKQELFDVPVLSQLLAGAGGIPVVRENKTPGGPDPFDAAELALRGGELVGVMPQGTIPRGPDFFSTDLKGYPGVARLAASTRVPVVPCAIWGTEQVWPRSSKIPQMFTYRNPPKITVRFGVPVELKYRSAAADTDRVMKAIAALLPNEARSRRRPTMQQLACSYPDGEVPAEDRWFARDVGAAPRDKGE
ncbi:MAG: HAD-IB family hydrolase [Allobranchiibius sp.]